MKPENKLLAFGCATLTIVIILIVILLIAEPVHAAEIEPTPEIMKVRTTLYTLHGTTASGVQAHHGCISGKKEWLGCSVMMFGVAEDGTPGEFIGYYEFSDTGGTKGLNNGTVIDVWCEDMDEVREWQRIHGDYTYILIIPNTTG